MSGGPDRDGETDVLIIGAGIGGLATLHHVRAMGFDAVVLEAGCGPGGTWFWNRYPGARCDVPSLQYSLGFTALAQEWLWSEKFATQPEILRYVERMVEIEDMRRHIRFGRQVTEAHFDQAAARWRLATADGERFSARFCVVATGTLSAVNRPDIPGLDDFRGDVHHTGAWPAGGVDLSGQRVGIIGTGSSGVQVIPAVANEAEHVTVFQRTAPYVVPARSRPLTDDERVAVMRRYPELRAQWRRLPNAVSLNFGTRSVMDADAAERRTTFEAAWEIGGPDFGQCFSDLARTPEARAEVQEYFRWKIRQIVTDPATAEILTPTFPWGSRRLCFGTDYYETYNQPNVSVVDLRATPIDRFTSDGLRTGGTVHTLDTLILATGYDAVTGALLRIDVRGRNGLDLRHVWRDGPRTYLGLAVSGFPNLFMVSGPQTPGTLINMAVGSEMHAEWIARCIAHVRAGRFDTIEARADAEDAWVEKTAALAAASIVSKSDSWWNGANIPGKPRGYLGYVDWLGYDASCQRAAENGYEGFVLGAASAVAA